MAARYRVSAPSKLACSSRCKSGPGKAWLPPGSECCVVEGDDHCEAYTTFMPGRLLSLARYDAAEAEAVDIAEGNMCGPVMRGSIAQPWSKTLSRTKGRRRNLGDLAFGRAVIIVPVRMGKVMSRSR